MKKNNRKKWLSLMTALVLLMQTFIPFIPNAEASTKSGQVVYNGPVSYAGSKVGDFTVDGEQAFCGATRFSISQ